MSKVVWFMLVGVVFAIHRDKIKLAQDYFSYKKVEFVCYLSCENQFNNLRVTKDFFLINARTSVIQLDKHTDIAIENAMYQWSASVGVVMDGACDNTVSVLEQGSKAKLFDAKHAWLVYMPDNYDSTQFIEDHFKNLNLSIDADLTVAGYNVNGDFDWWLISSETGEKELTEENFPVCCDSIYRPIVIITTKSDYTLIDVFNFGKIQQNSLEIASLGSWRPDNGLNIYLKGFKYYHRWDFHNLTLRAISVMLDRPEVFEPGMLSGGGYTPGVAAMTKITSQLLNLLKEQHNFRFRYTIVDRWIGSPKRNSTLAVTNSLLWGEQDVSSTCARIFPLWLNWVDICFPPTTALQTKFYYLMLEKGVGAYENRFLTPLSLGVWWSTLGACALCMVVLAAAARLEARSQPGLYAFFSVSAALLQQDFEDGNQEERLHSQGRKLTLLVVGLTSMLVYNYYTSSVVSWLLSATAPSIDSLDQLIASDLELIFEDIGYTRGWLENPGFFYYSGYVNPKEDRMREVKVNKAKRTVPPLQPVKTGIELMRTGSYAYHTEPYTASQEIGHTFVDEELCSLGSLLVMQPANVYIMVQKQSPYKEFFVWSLMRLSERGHLQASRRRFAGTMPACSGRKPRALALGQAAPAFLVLLQLSVLSVLILLAERAWYRAGERYIRRLSRNEIFERT